MIKQIHTNHMHTLLLTKTKMVKKEQQKSSLHTKSNYLTCLTSTTFVYNFCSSSYHVYTKPAYLLYNNSFLSVTRPPPQHSSFLRLSDKNQLFIDNFTTSKSNFLYFCTTNDLHLLYPPYKNFPPPR